MVRFVTTSGVLLAGGDDLSSLVKDSASLQDLYDNLYPQLPDTHKNQTPFRLLHGTGSLKTVDELGTLPDDVTLVVLTKACNMAARTLEVAMDATAKADQSESYAQELQDRIMNQMKEESEGSDGHPEQLLNTDLPLPRVMVELSSNLMKDKGAGIVEAMKAVEEELEAKKKAAVEGNDGAATQTPSGELDVDDIAAQVCSLIPEEAMEILLELGFPFPQVQRSLLEHNMDQQSAANALLSGGVSATEFTEGDWRRYEKLYLQPQQPQSTSGRKVASAELVKLMDMGFPEKDAQYALRGSNGNFDEACAALLGDAQAISRIKSRQGEMEWVDKLEADAQEGNLDPAIVITAVESMVKEPQSLLQLWHGKETKHTLYRMCELLQGTDKYQSDSANLSRTESEMLHQSQLARSQ